MTAKSPGDTLKLKMRQGVWWWRFAVVFLTSTYALAFYQLELPFHMVFPPLTFFLLGRGKGYMDQSKRDLAMIEGLEKQMNTAIKPPSRAIGTEKEKE